jgi:hypothetical protein
LGGVLERNATVAEYGSPCDAPARQTFLTENPIHIFMHTEPKKKKFMHTAVFIVALNAYS